MSGQSAGLTIKEAKTMMKRTECQTNQHQGGNGNSSTGNELCKKTPHQGK